MAHAPITAQGVESLKSKRLREVNVATLQPSVTSNSRKELLVLEYVDNFRAQFQDVFPRRRPLFLTAKNEAGVEKFVCTTLRPTQVPYREVSGGGGAAVGACAAWWTAQQLGSISVVDWPARPRNGHPVPAPVSPTAVVAVSLCTNRHLCCACLVSCHTHGLAPRHPREQCHRLAHCVLSHPAAVRLQAVCRVPGGRHAVRAAGRP